MFLFIVLSTSISARENVTLGIPVFPPHSLIDELTNECVGGFVTATKKILAEHAINVDVVCAPPIRIYRLLKNAEVDFIINIKSTKALPKDIIFVETPFNTLYLALYTHKNSIEIKNVAAIRGFGYHGFRDKLMGDGYDFFDLPTSTSAIQLFLKKRSSHLISYRSPVEYHIKENNLDIEYGVSVLPLLDVRTYYAISAKSAHLGKLQTALEDYASKHQLTFFDQAN